MMRSIIAALAVLTAAPAAAQEIHPVLYVAHDADSTLYLFGTVHVRPRGMPWGGPEAAAALASADEVWTEMLISPEADAQAQALMSRLSAAPADKPLSTWLTAEQNAHLAALTQRLGLSQDVVQQMQPWAAGLMLTLVPLMRSGYDPQSGVDRAIDGFGDANGKTMRAFETVEQQLNFIASLSPEIQRQMLLEAIDEAEEGPSQFRDMDAAWAAGDEATLERLVIADTRTDYPELYQKLFVDRNNAWIDVILRELDGAGVDFVAVGAGHLLGADGLVAQLRARGVSVERVRPAE